MVNILDGRHIPRGALKVRPLGYGIDKKMVFRLRVYASILQGNINVNFKVLSMSINWPLIFFKDFAQVHKRAL